MYRGKCRNLRLMHHLAFKQITNLFVGRVDNECALVWLKNNKTVIGKPLQSCPDRCAAETALLDDVCLDNLFVWQKLSGDDRLSEKCVNFLFCADFHLYRSSLC